MLKKAMALAVFGFVGLTACGPPLVLVEPPASTSATCPGVASSPPTVVGVATETTRGSGFFVSREVVVTAAHAVVGQTIVRVEIPEFGARLASVVASNAYLDVAILRLELPVPASFAVFSRAIPEKGGVVAAHFHAPQVGVTQGHFQGVVQRSFDVQYLQADIPAVPGMSGGPITDGCGAVVAVAARSIDGGLAGTLSSEILRMLRYEGVLGKERN